MKTWVHIPKNSDFSIYNIPFGIFSHGSNQPRIGIAIGDQVLDLVISNKLGIFKHINFDEHVLSQNYLNKFIALGKTKTSEIRRTIQEELCSDSSILKNNDSAFLSQSKVTMLLPVDIGDYTDFYSSLEHATNVGMMFRDPKNALLPNWKYLPVGYHGRSSSIVVSNEKIHRPKGQVLLANSTIPSFQPSTKVDFELEMGFIIGKNSILGESVSVVESKDYIFGKVLFNDWSARDIQKWEYVPLGPFLGKSFASSISPWVVTLEALEPYRTEGPKQEPDVFPYLEQDGNQNYDINLEVILQPSDGVETVISKSNFKYMYWSMFQQLAHHTSNGCNIRVGDLLASGTISGKEPTSYGSMLELSWGGKKSVTLNNGTKRKFLEDYDTIIMKGYCEISGKRIGFGEVRTQLLPTL